MATTTPAVKSEKPAAPKKPPVAAAVRIVDQMKRAALINKITIEELDDIAELAAALKVFLK